MAGHTLSLGGIGHLDARVDRGGRREKPAALPGRAGRRVLECTVHDPHVRAHGPDAPDCRLRLAYEKSLLNSSLRSPYRNAPRVDLALSELPGPANLVDRHSLALDPFVNTVALHPDIRQSPLRTAVVQPRRKPFSDLPEDPQKGNMPPTCQVPDHSISHFDQFEVARQDKTRLSHFRCSGFCRMPATATAFATKDTKVTKNGARMLRPRQRLGHKDKQRCDNDFVSANSNQCSSPRLIS